MSFVPDTPHIGYCLSTESFSIFVQHHCLLLCLQKPVAELCLESVHSMSGLQSFSLKTYFNILPFTYSANLWYVPFQDFQKNAVCAFSVFHILHK